MKVFVLICESIYDYADETMSCAVYDTLEKAQEQMKKEFAETSKEWNVPNTWVIDEGERHALFYPEGYFPDTHCQWTIEEKEVA